MREIKSKETSVECLPEVKLSPIFTFTANNEIIFELRCGSLSLAAVAIIADVFGVTPSLPWESASLKLASSLLYIMLLGVSSVLISESIMDQAVPRNQTVTVRYKSFLNFSFFQRGGLIWFSNSAQDRECLWAAEYLHIQWSLGGSIIHNNCIYAYCCASITFPPVTRMCKMRSKPDIWMHFYFGVHHFHIRYNKYIIHFFPNIFSLQIWRINCIFF